MTLNKLKDILIFWWEQHAQINHVYFGSQETYLALANKEYVSIAIEYLQSNFQAKNIVHSYRFTLSDLYNPNIESHEDYIYSALMQIVEDFDMFLRFRTDFTINSNLSVIPFSDDSKDRVSGVVFNLNIAVEREINECQKPTK